MAGTADFSHSIFYHPLVELLQGENSIKTVDENLTCSPGANESLQLVGFDPDNIVNPIVAPYGKEFSAQLYSSTRHPKKDKPIVLAQVTL